MQNPSDFNQPVRSLQTMLQTISRADGTESRVIPDGIYGAETVDAVSNFQRNHALPVTGAVNESTWNAIVKSFSSAQVYASSPYPLVIPMKPGCRYRAGDENSNIALAQCIALEIARVFKCISPTPINGKMDEPTCLCMEQFQELCDLAVTGDMDMMTWKYLVLCYPIAFSLDKT